MDTPLLVVKDLVKHFPITRGLLFSKQINAIQAVDGVSLNIEKGETLGLVGESGCGKTTVGRCVLRLIEPTSGSIVFNGKDLMNYDRMMRPLRKQMQIIFQDPFASLNPRKKVGTIIGEPLSIHENLKTIDRTQRVQELLELVGLRSKSANRYPHEFSGGQRQRIGIARALSLNPQLIIADEPVSALDVSVQAQILNLLIDLQKRFKIAYLFISHDLSVVRHISDRVAVMYLGRIVELADKNTLYNTPLHPYTKLLMSAIPNLDPLKRSKKTLLEGDVPSPINPPEGCHFHPRCPQSLNICKIESPSFYSIYNNEKHYVACHVVHKCLNA